MKKSSTPKSSKKKIATTNIKPEKKVTAGSVVFSELERLHGLANKPCSQTWYQCMEHLPEEERLVICYSEVFRSYYIGIYSPYRGWRRSTGDALLNITHWLDSILFLPFDNLNRVDPIAAEKYGVY